MVKRTILLQILKAKMTITKMESIKIHATWGFLVETEELDGVVGEKSFKEFWGDFYDDKYSDGDNWNLPMVIIHDTGDIIPLCEDGAYRGTDWMWKKLRTKIQMNQRFEWGLHFLTGCIAIDFDVPGTRGGLFTRGARSIEYDELPRSVILQEIGEWLPVRLKAVLDMECGIAPPAPDRKDEGYWDWHTLYDTWRRKRFIQVYRQWLNARDWDKRFGIFGNEENIRCGYRAMQIGEPAYWEEGHEHAKPLSLVFLDYHY